MIRINLIGQELEEKPGSRFSLPQLSLGGGQVAIAAVLVAVLALIGLAWWYQARQLGVLNNRIATVRAERERLQDVADQVQELREESDLLRQKLDVIVQLKANQTGPVMLLDQISRNITDGLWLTGLDLEGGSVDLEGAALSEVGVADFVEALGESRFFDGVRLRTLGDTGESFRFRVTFTFEPTPAAVGVSAPQAEGG